MKPLQEQQHRIRALEAENARMHAELLSFRIPWMYVVRALFWWVHAMDKKNQLTE